MYGIFIITLLLLVLSAGSTSRVVDSKNGTPAATHWKIKTADCDYAPDQTTIR